MPLHVCVTEAGALPFLTHGQAEGTPGLGRAGHGRSPESPGSPLPPSHPVLSPEGTQLGEQLGASTLKRPVEEPAVLWLLWGSGFRNTTGSISDAQAWAPLSLLCLPACGCTVRG